MTWSAHHHPERRGYHHGNLREALIEASLDLIAEKGPAGFTITEAARRAGVSSAAPYRHFRDADALLVEVALRGFDQFAQALTLAWNDGRPDPLSGFTALGHAYLNFARQHPAYYAAMFETHAAPEASPPLIAAANQAFQVLRSATEELIAGIPQPDRPPALMMALHIWSLSHGIASLFCRPDRARRALPMAPEDLLEAGVLVYLRGLGLAGGTLPNRS
jgi:AcrR family transcriptional regulator